MKFTSVKKKTRGMRRKARKLASWAEHHKQLDIAYLLQYRKDYVKIWISPFYNLHQINANTIGKKNPPYRFRKQILHHLIAIYWTWRERLEQLDQPYYLKIWLADPEFMDSQVVAAVGSEIEYYNRIFMENNVPRAFPHQLAHPLATGFYWQRCVNGYYVMESDLETEAERIKVRHQAYKVEEISYGGSTEAMYYIQTGDMWTGIAH